MPCLEEIGQPVSIEYDNVYTRAYVFCSDADYLICRYDAENYTLQKKRLEENYIFQAEILDPYEYPCELCEEVSGYHFRVLSTEGEYGNDIYYPKCLVLIAHSDEVQEIVYLSFYDIDLDYITSLTEFINEECGWKYVR